MALSQEEIIRTLLASRTQVLAAAWLVVRDAHVAEDLFQTTMVKAIGGGTLFEREAALISWAMVTARHQALNWVRDRRSQALVLDAAVLDLLEADWVRAGASRDRVDALQKCLAELPADARRLLELRYYDECTCGQVAATLRLSLDAVYQRLSRLHRSLRSCIERRLASGSEGLSQV